MRTARLAFVAFVALVASAACSSWTRPNPQTGPGYSTVPCSDNCGNDANCLRNCQPASNNPPPPGIMPGR